MISFIMMAKNEENYIEESILALVNQEYQDWELIVIDDGSEDNTFEIARHLSEVDKRIIVKKNKFKGKVLGTNYGFSLTRGDIIKCIDADDILLGNFFDHVTSLEKSHAQCHSAYIVDSDLKQKSTYYINPLLIDKDFSFILSYLISVPKWTWSFSRELANKIFPMPEDLPFEDVWMSLMVKKFATEIRNIKEPLYLYRQHQNQTFGGINNFNKKTVVFRAKRLLRLISVLEKQIVLQNDIDPSTFKSIKEYNHLLSLDTLSVLSIIKSHLGINQKFKVFLIRKMPYLAKITTIIKWKIDSTKNRG